MFLLFILSIVGTIYYLVVLAYWYYKSKYKDTNTGYELKMIRGNWKRGLPFIVSFVACIFLAIGFLQPVSYETIIGNNVDKLKVIYTFPEKENKELSLENKDVILGILSEFEYRRDIINSYSDYPIQSMETLSWIDFSVCDKDGWYHHLTISSNGIVFDSRSEVVYRVVEYNDELYSRVIEYLY